MKKVLLTAMMILAIAATASADVVNGGFETGDTSGWEEVLSGAAGAVSTDYANSGTYSVAIDSTGAGQWSSPNLVQKFSASEGDVASMSAWMLQTALGATDWGTIKLEWKDINGNNIGIGAGLIEGVIDGLGAPYEGVVGTTQLGAGKVETLNTWVATSISATAPAGTVEAAFYLMNVNGTGGAVYHFDDVTGSVVPEPATMGLFALAGGAMLLLRRRLRII